MGSPPPGYKTGNKPPWEALLLSIKQGITTPGGLLSFLSNSETGRRAAGRPLFLSELTKSAEEARAL